MKNYRSYVGIRFYIKNPGWLGYVGDYTTQLYRDYNKHINHCKDPVLKQPVFHGMSKGFFYRGSWMVQHIVRAFFR